MTKTRQGTLTAEIEIVGADSVAYPEISIRYSLIPGCPETGPSYASGGEPATGPEIELISASLVAGDGLSPTQEQIDAWAQAYLDSDAGFDAVVVDVLD